MNTNTKFIRISHYLHVLTYTPQKNLEFVNHVSHFDTSCIRMYTAMKKYRIVYMNK